MPPPKMPRKPQDQAIRFEFADVKYSFSLGAVQDKHETSLWVNAGVTVPDCVQAVTRGAIFGLVGLVYLARLQAGHTVDYAMVDREIREMVADGRLAEEFKLVTEDEEDPVSPFDPSAIS